MLYTPHTHWCRWFKENLSWDPTHKARTLQNYREMRFPHQRSRDDLSPSPDVLTGKHFKQGRRRFTNAHHWMSQTKSAATLRWTVESWGGLRNWVWLKTDATQIPRTLLAIGINDPNPQCLNRLNKVRLKGNVTFLTRQLTQLTYHTTTLKSQKNVDFYWKPNRNILRNRNTKTDPFDWIRDRQLTTFWLLTRLVGVPAITKVR